MIWKKAFKSLLLRAFKTDLNVSQCADTILKGKKTQQSRFSSFCDMANTASSRRKFMTLCSSGMGSFWFLKGEEWRNCRCSHSQSSYGAGKCCALPLEVTYNFILQHFYLKKIKVDCIPSIYWCNSVKYYCKCR